MTGKCRVPPKLDGFNGEEVIDKEQVKLERSKQ
jgi:hypothetical protein